MSRGPLPEAWVQAFDGILQRGYYANNGPLVRQFEQELCRRLEVPFAVAVNSGMGAAMSALGVLAPTGPALIASDCGPWLRRSLDWYGIPAWTFESGTHLEVSVRGARQGASILITSGFVAEADRVAEVCEQAGLSWMHDVSAGLRNTPAAHIDICDLERSSLRNPAAGGCTFTRDAGLADLLRKSRSFKAGSTPEMPARRMNFKMSEAQAALGLWALDG
ncbi:hypothetical protein ABI59_18960 [Acidobacteria bacterium Mor1]|nr:hypothetical protein ABI59_18960 [Acidobacteria bacterium Mor1]